MHQTLLKDPRYVSDIELSRTELDALLKQLNAFTGRRRMCADKITNNYQSAVYHACKQHHCGDNVDGGCDHIAGFALSDAAIKRAVQKCKAK